MKIVDKSTQQIFEDTELNNKFTSVVHNNLDINCNFLKGNFYLDTYNYFPITEECYSFFNDFKWGNFTKYRNFYTDEFYANFNKKIKNFKSLSNVFVLGSSSINNYYRNVVTFLPRLFFIKEKKIKIAINRSCSNKFREFIRSLCIKMNKEIQFVYLDEGFYKFKNSTIPQFFSKQNSVKILNTLKIDKSEKIKLFITRQNSSFRNLINEGDVVEHLKANNFRIVDLNNYSILEQIKLFSNADVIVSPTGSGLTNIVFCNEATKVVEIAPVYNFEYEQDFKSRFFDICDILNLQYYLINADSINIDKIDYKTRNTLGSKALRESNYYKNLLLKIEKVKQITGI